MPHSSPLPAKLRQNKGSRPKESVAELEDLTKDAFRIGLDNIRELAELAAKSQVDSLNVLKSNIHQNINEVRKLLHRQYTDQVRALVSDAMNLCLVGKFIAKPTWRD